tara:strand:- start:248 stop:544 length:297 start_codon:yes stop_codon:yes gene_type:complete
MENIMNSKQYWWARANLPQPVTLWLYDCSELLPYFGYRKTAIFALGYIVSKDFRDEYNKADAFAALGHEWADSALHYLEAHPFRFDDAAFHALCEWDT